MFTRLLRWWKERFGKVEEEVVEVIEPLPEDVWDRAVVLCERLAGREFMALTLMHFDQRYDFRTTSIDQAFEYLETCIHSITTETAILGAWEHRRRTPMRMAMPDYFYSDKFGYRSPESTVALLSEKIAIIHNLLVTKEMDVRHPHYPYIRREFSAVMCDVDNVLTFIQTLVKQ